MRRGELLSTTKNASVNNNKALFEMRNFFVFTALTLCVEFLLFFISSKSDYDDDNGWIEGTNSLSLTTLYYRWKEIAFHCACFAIFFLLYIITSCAPPNKMRKTIPDDIYCFLFLSHPLTRTHSNSNFAVWRCVLSGRTRK